MIIFIIGCARSGTSILGELIGAHHQAFYIGEQMQSIWYGMSTVSHHRMTRDDVTPGCKAIVKSCFDKLDSQVPDNQLWIEKTPPNILRTMFIHGILPEAKFIHIVRDGRDVACSLVPGLTDSWQHLKPPGWQNAELIYPNEPLKRGAWLWSNALYFGLSDLHKINHLQIRYENLVCDPLGIAKQVFAYLEMVVDSNIMAFCSKIQDRTQGSYHALGQSHWFRDDHEYRVGRWRENIPKDKVVEIEFICQPILEQLEYEKRRVV